MFPKIIGKSKNGLEEREEQIRGILEWGSEEKDLTHCEKMGTLRMVVGRVEEKTGETLLNMVM